MIESEGKGKSDRAYTRGGKVAVGKRHGSGVECGSFSGGNVARGGKVSVKRPQGSAGESGFFSRADAVSAGKVSVGKHNGSGGETGFSSGANAAHGGIVSVKKRHPTSRGIKVQLPNPSDKRKKPVKKGLISQGKERYTAMRGGKVAVKCSSRMLRDFTDDDEHDSSEDGGNGDDSGEDDGYDVGNVIGDDDVGDVVGDDASDDVGDDIDVDASGEDSGEETDHTSGRKWIKRHGDKFGCQVVHRSATLILEQHYDGDWATFRKCPLAIKSKMFKMFRTKWRWHKRDDQDVRTGFLNVLKDRFRDIMREYRRQSKGKAREAGHDIADNEEKFEITCMFPPDAVPAEKWKRLCKLWNTPKWLAKSSAGRKNRSSEASRHTGGSMGFDEHRINLEKKNGGPVGFDLVFFDTHATKVCKKRVREGEITFNDVDELEFVTKKSKKSFTLFKRELVKLSGEDCSEKLEDCDHLAVWKSLHSESSGRHLYGVGSSDPHLVVNGRPSSTACESLAYIDAPQSREVQDLRSELEREREARKSLELGLEQERVERERVLEEERAGQEQERAERDAKVEKLQKQLDEIMKKLADK